MSLRTFTCVKTAYSGQLLVAALSLCALRGEAATWIWAGGTGSWAAPANWDVNTVPLSDPATSLVFEGSGATSYTSTHNIGPAFVLNRLIFQSSASVAETLTAAGPSTLSFSNNGAALASILQNGSGAFDVDMKLEGSDTLQFGGTGTGLVNIPGVVAVEQGLNFTAAQWRLSNINNTFKGGVTVGTGSSLELLAASGPTSLNRSTTSGLLGVVNQNEVMIDGGTIKVSTKGVTSAGGYFEFGNFSLKFGPAGGVLDLTNSNPSVPASHGGTIGISAANNGGSIALQLDNSAAAVVKFNGGQLGLPTYGTATGDWPVNQNALRVGSFNGTGPARFELTNGALAQAGIFTTGNPAITRSFDAAVTYRGVAGGDPTSGPLGLINPGTKLDSGRVAVNRSDLTYNQGLRLEDALQVAALNGSSRLTGGLAGITLAGVASGHPARVAFSGRPTSNSNYLTDTILLPTVGGPGQNVLWLGTNGGVGLTIEKGAEGIFDARIRPDQSTQNGVYLDGRAVLQAGGVLRIAQSITNFSPSSSMMANVGDITLHGPIEGMGSTLDEAVLDIRLPAPAAGGTIASGVPAPVPTAASGIILLTGVRPFGGLVAQPSHQIIINGSGFGGLRVEANARPDSSFSATGVRGGPAIPDPTPNATKIAAYLTGPRLAALTGSGGYLTAAPTGQGWNFPAGGEWGAAAPVGLRVTDHNPSGVDVNLAALSSFQHNLAVDAGATVDLGSAPFSFGPATVSAGLGTLHGKGTVLTGGGLNVSIGGKIAPGMADVGTLTVERLNLSGGLEVEGHAAATDVLRVVGDLVLGATSQLTVPAGTVLGPRNYRVVLADTSTGTFGSVTGVPASHVVSYTRPGEVWFSYVSGRNLTWKGDASNQWNFTAQNWTSPTVFMNGDRLVFDDSATGSHNVSLTGGDLEPASVQVNTASGYTLTSSLAGAFAGTGELIKTGTGTLTLSGPASFEGGILVQQGLLQTTVADSIPDIGRVVVSSGAQLNLGAAERIDDLTVAGSLVASAPLTARNVRLQDATSFQAALVLENKITKTGAPLTLAQPIDFAGGVREVNVGVGTSPELTITGAITNGGLDKAGPGTLVLGGTNALPGGITIREGTLRAGVPGAIPANTGVTLTGGTLDLNAIPHSLGALNSSGNVMTGGAALSVNSLGGTGGAIALGGGALQVTQSTKTRYDGNISTTGVLTKLGAGSLALGGTNSITGGTLVNEGFLRIASPTAATVGTITVNLGGTLVADETISAPIVLAGGTLGSRFEEPAVTGDLTATAGTSSMILIADPEDLMRDSEVVIHGRLRGSGDLLVQPSPNGEGADRNQGMRLRGTVPSDFTGTITLQQGVKMELQSSVAGPFSPAGSAKIVMNAGTLQSDRRGTFSQLNLRNNFAGDTVIGNDVEVLGSGVVNFGPVTDPSNLGQPIAPVGSRIAMGNLRIGGGQIAAVNKNGSEGTTPTQGVQFSSVTMTGGDVGFAPQMNQSGFSFRSDLALGSISETAPSNLFMVGEANLLLLGTNTYTGRTELVSGTTWLGATGALPATTSLVLSGGDLNFQNRSGTSFNQTVASLSGVDGTTITNTAVAVRDFTINQSTDTVFRGSIEGALNVVKNGPGRLTLTNRNAPSGLFTIAGGEVALSEQGEIRGSLAVQNSGTLSGSGVVGVITIAGGGAVTPGDEVGKILAGLVTAQAGATFAFDLNGTVAGTGYDQIEVVDTFALSGLVNLELGLGFQPAFADPFTLVLNSGLGAIGGGGRFVYKGNVLENSEQFTVADGGFEQIFEIRYDGSSGNDVVLTAVPEPGTTVLLVAGIALCARRRRGENDQRKD